jgi:tetratricopeptide (TPR) repeat protein
MVKYFYTVTLCLLTTAFLLAQPVKQAVVFFNKGAGFEQKGMFPDAIIAYKKAIALNKKYDSAYLGLALVYAKTSRVDSAIFTLKKAVAVNPGFANGYVALGNLYRDNLNKPDDAIENYLNALKIDSTNKVTYYSLAWCYNAKNYYREAITYGVKALGIDNNYRPAYNELGHSYHMLKAYQEGIDQFKKNLAISVNDLPMLYTGYCYMELNQKEDALKTYEELKKINPKMAEALKRKLDAMK